MALLDKAKRQNVDPSPFCPQPEPAKMEYTLQRALTRAYAAHWQDKAVGPTRSHYIKYMLDYFPPGIALDNITTAMVNDFKQHLISTRGILGRTVNHWFSVLSITYKHAQSEGYTGSVPRFTRDTTEGVRDKFFSLEEENMILTYMQNFETELAYHFHIMLFDIGSRLTATSRLHMTDDVKTLNGVLCLQFRRANDKKKKGRTIPLTQRCEAIVKHYKARGIKQPFRQLNKDRVNGMWQRMRKALNITEPDFVTHAIRHTVATRLLQRGVPPKVVKEYVGLSSSKVLELYTHVVSEDKITAMRKLEDGTQHHGSPINRTLRVVK